MILSSYTNLLYIDFDHYLLESDKQIFEYKSEYIIIKFNLLNSISPLLISLIYIYSNTYTHKKIIKLNMYYAIFYQPSNQLNIDKISVKYKQISEPNINKYLYLVQIDDYFIKELTYTLTRIIIKELINNLRTLFVRTTNLQIADANYLQY